MLRSLFEGRAERLTFRGRGERRGIRGSEELPQPSKTKDAPSDFRLGDSGAFRGAFQASEKFLFFPLDT